MKISDAIGLSTRMFKARRLRTFLTILGMSVGIGAILFLVSLGYGLQKALLDRITTSDSLLTLDVTAVKSEAVVLDQAMLEKIKVIPGVENASPAFQVAAQGSYKDVSLDLVALGTTPIYLRLSGIKLSQGTSLSDTEPYHILISSSLAGVLEENPSDIIGKNIDLNFFLSQDSSDNSGSNSSPEKVSATGQYIISGIFPSEESNIYIHANSFPQDRIKTYAQLKVKCKTSGEMAIVREQILSQGLMVSSLSDTVDQANKIFQVIQIILSSFGVVALVVSAIGMFNTMTIALLERTEEIGIMKSIGAYDSNISALFILESMIMGSLGGILGVLLGLLGGWGMNFAVNFLAVRLGGQAVTLFYSPPWFVGLIIIFSTLVGLITGSIPARRASKIDPLDALRYK